MPATLASASGSMSTPPPKKKRGGFFSCRSKHALDSLPRDARGSKAAIHQLQARDIFQREADDFLALTPATVTEEKGPLSHAEHNRTTSSLPPSTLHEEPVKKLYAQEVVDGQEDVTTEFVPTHLDEDINEKEEARDVLPDPVVLSPADTPGVVRSMSVSSKTGRIKRSLSLKRSGSTASTNLIARAPPVSSADFADLPESNDSDDKENASLGDLASIRKARGRHQIGGQPLVPDISEDEYIKFDHVPIPIKPQAPEEQAQKPALAVSIPESDSMRAVAAALESSSDSARFRSGPSVGTPRMESPCSTTTAFAARIRDGSDDTVPELRTPTRSSTFRGFWDSTLDESWGPGRGIPFQYVTNLSRPVSIASLRSLATPSTPPRTSSRAAGLRMAKSFSVSPLKQGTFNGFPRTFFPPSTIHQSTRKAHDEADEEDVERQLSHPHTASCSHCGAPPDSQRDFASFVAKGKASRHTSVKQQTLNSSSSTTQAAATGSLRKSKSALLKGPGEGTLKRWGLAEAFKSNPAGEGSIGGGGKKMVPGPAGAYITDTANMRWCSALDEIKKALKDDTEHDGEEAEEAQEEGTVKKETQTAVEADEMLARYGVAM